MATPTTLLDTLGLELRMLTDSYELVVKQAIRLLENDGDNVSTHLGHNLGNRAAELSVLAGKIDSVARVISDIRAREVLNGGK